MNNKRMSRIICIILTVILSFTLSISAYAESKPCKEDYIKAIADVYAKNAGISVSENAVVSLTDNAVIISDYDDEEMTNVYVLQSYRMEDEHLSVVNPNETLIEALGYNTYTDAFSVTLSSSIYITLSVQLSYYKYAGVGYGIYFYRPIGFVASWSKGQSGQNVTVTQMTVNYGHKGALMSYPACTTASNPSTAVISEFYEHNITILQASPVENQSYYNYSNPLGSSYAMWLVGLFSGAFVNWTFTTNYGSSSSSAVLTNVGY